MIIKGKEQGEITIKKITRSKVNNKKKDKEWNVQREHI